MGELDGIAATRLITTAAPATKVILVSTYELEDLPPGAPVPAARSATSTRTSCRRRVVRRLWEDRAGDPISDPRLGDTDVVRAARSIARSGQRERAGHGRALPRLRSHRQRAAEGAEAVGHVDEAVAVARRRRWCRTRRRRHRPRTRAPRRPPRLERRRMPTSPACLPAFCSASSTQKYTAASMSAP